MHLPGNPDVQYCCQESSERVSSDIVRQHYHGLFVRFCTSNTKTICIIVQLVSKIYTYHDMIVCDDR